jgi:hypothetical protein
MERLCTTSKGRWVFAFYTGMTITLTVDTVLKQEDSSEASSDLKRNLGNGNGSARKRTPDENESGCFRSSGRRKKNAGGANTLSNPNWL